MFRLLALSVLLGCPLSAERAGESDKLPDSGAEADSGRDSETDSGANEPGGEDTACLQVWYFDGDEDGFGHPDLTTSGCVAPIGYVGEGTDCDDEAATTYPGAPEVCDGADQDCDTQVDEDAVDRRTFYADDDNDSYGDASVSTVACDAPVGFVGNADDCDDTDNATFPGGLETCEGTDQDCDGDVDEAAVDATNWHQDLDADGAGDPGVALGSCSQPAGYVANDADCDDTNAEISPDADELCDGIDQDCDGNIDEAAIDPATWYLDVDGDGYGTDTLTYLGCSSITGYVATDDDCDDTNSAAHPGGTETCGGRDEDCDGEIDESSAADAPTWYADSDGDGYGDVATIQVACTVPSAFAADSTDCNDTDALTHPNGTELCGGTDENCDGSTDESTAANAVDYYVDADGDTFGDYGSPGHGCLAAGATTDATDCDDSEAGVNPAAQEVCGDSTDDDCDGSASECFSGPVLTSDASATLSGGTAMEYFGAIAAGGDIDGDGSDDLAVLASYHTQVGYGFYGPVASGTSASADWRITDFGGDESASGFSRGLWMDYDFDGDGLVDIVHLTDNLRAVEILAGAPDAPSWTFATVDGASQDSEPGDVDGDGLGDLVIATGNEFVVMTNADGCFASYIAYPSGCTGSIGNGGSGTMGYPWNVSSGGDINGDGTDEIVLGTTVDAWVFTGITGASTASSVAAMSAMADAHFVSTATEDRTRLIGDTNGDGYDDIALPGYDKGWLYISTNAGVGGTWASVATATITDSYSYFPGDIDSADLDADGAADLVCSAHTGAYGFYGPVSGTLSAPVDADFYISGEGAQWLRAGFAGDVLGTGGNTLFFGWVAESTAATYAGRAWLFDIDG